MYIYIDTYTQTDKGTYTHRQRRTNVVKKNPTKLLKFYSVFYFILYIFTNNFIKIRNNDIWYNHFPDMYALAFMKY